MTATLEPTRHAVPVSPGELLRARLIASLADLAAAREYAAAYPEACPAPRADGCPECGASPGIIAGTRLYRAWVPSGGRCTSAWHEAAL